MRLFTNIEDGHNAGVREASGGAGFEKEPLAVFLLFLGIFGQQSDRLDGDHAVNLGIARLVDDAHRAASELFQDLVSSYERTGSTIHCRGVEKTANRVQRNREEIGPKGTYSR